MNKVITLPQLTALMSRASGIEQSICRDFIVSFTSLIAEGLCEGEQVRIKGLGAFKSVDGPGGVGVEFVPERDLANKINAPFAAFEPVELAGDIDFDSLGDDKPSSPTAYAQAAGAPADEFEPFATVDFTLPADAARAGDEPAADSADDAEPEAEKPAPEAAAPEPAPEVVPPVFDARTLTETSLPSNPMIDELQQIERERAERIKHLTNASSDAPIPVAPNPWTGGEVGQPTPPPPAVDASPVPDTPVVTPASAAEPAEVAVERVPEPLPTAGPEPQPAYESEPYGAGKNEERNVRMPKRDYYSDRIAQKDKTFRAPTFILVAVISIAVGLGLGYLIHNWSANNTQDVTDPVAEQTPAPMDVADDTDTEDLASADTVSEIDLDDAQASTRPDADGHISPEAVAESAPAQPSAPAQQAPTPKPVYDTISRGRLLTTMALDHYGHKDYWVYIYMANADKIKNPNKIPAGTRLRIPDRSEYDISKDESENLKYARRKGSEILAKHKN